MMRELTKDLGGEIAKAKTSPTEWTHLITKAGQCGSNSNRGASARRVCARTEKYCHAVLTGTWVVSSDWLRACKAAKKWVDELPYEMEGDHSSLDIARTRGLGAAGGPQRSVPSPAHRRGAPRTNQRQSARLIHQGHPSPGGEALSPSGRPAAARPR